MQTTELRDRQYFSITSLVLYVCIVAFIWSVGPIQLFKPNTAIAVQVLPTTRPMHHVISGLPTRVIVPDVGLDLPVVEGTYDQASASWSVGNHKAYYASLTPPINDFRGTTLIYGHNNRTAFKRLHNLSAGASLTVYTDTGNVFHYRLQKQEAVDPSNTSLFSLGGQPHVILQTCGGAWNELRQLYTFRLQSIDKATINA